MDYIDSIIKIGVSTFCGIVVGIERQLHGKPAGIRTSALICFGTTLFVLVGQQLHGATTDPTRVLGQIITGIGFIGAGVIITRGGDVQGVTSAAVIWTLTAIGCASGFGYYLEAIVLSLFVLFVLVSVKWLEKAFPRLRKGVHKD
jgi:putative Mg2+ transporter-C (MgtC) family protein